MRIILVGPGRAGMALSRALLSAGHSFAGVLARRAEEAEAAAVDLETVPLDWGTPLPAADLLVIAVHDGAIEEVAARLVSVATRVGSAVHLSGLKPVASLDALADRCRIGSFHPLQTLPTPEAGAARLAGAWVGVTAPDPRLRDELFGLAESIGARPFDLEDQARAVYHAAAAAASNFPLAALAMAEDLFAAAEVPFEAAGPLIRAVIENALALGPRRALTGPIARGDVETVAEQLAAVDRLVPAWGDEYRDFAGVVARVAGRSDDFSEVLE
ncbi:MAG: DUF2520 domain-containing protein [Acidimicrobiia bacterium]